MLNIIKMRSADLIPYAFNNRKHPEQQIDRIANSIKEFGFNQPIVIDESNVVLVGHGRLAAALKLGLQEVPVVKIESLSEAKKKAYRILDNKLQNDSEWDFANIEMELNRLEELDFDLAEWGLDELLAMAPTEEPEVSEDSGPGAIPDEPFIKRGDIIELGPHRVMCGDSTSAEDVGELMRGAKASLVFTSPPYAYQREYDTDLPDWDALMAGAFGVLEVTDNCQILVNLGLVHEGGEWIPYWDKWIENMRANGWKRFGWYVWDQGPGLPGDWNGRFAPAFEFIFHFNKEPRQPNKIIECKHAGEMPHGKGLRRKDGTVDDWSSMETPVHSHRIGDSVLRIMRHKERGIECHHPAVFPIELSAFVLQSYSKINDTTYEPFLGSGTTLLAADQLGRICYGMEISPNYCQVILERYQRYCAERGKECAVKINGEPFNSREYKKDGEDRAEA